MHCNLCIIEKYYFILLTERLNTFYNGKDKLFLQVLWFYYFDPYPVHIAS